MEVIADQRCSFLGNVTVGKDVSLATMQEMYHAVNMVPCMLNANLALHVGLSTLLATSVARMKNEM